MLRDERISTSAIRGVFVEEITARRGTVSEPFDDGRRLFLRSILPDVTEVRRNDRVQGGVALRANGQEAWIHPYVFRQVCKNGAIMARAIQTRHVAEFELREPDEVLAEIREAVAACCAPEAFSDAAERMRSSQEVVVDLALTLMPFAARFPGTILSQLMRQFFGEADHSAFGLANAITATARDQSDPDLRWRLEEFGGGVFVDPTPRRPSDDRRAALREPCSESDALLQMVN